MKYLYLNIILIIIIFLTFSQVDYSKTFSSTKIATKKAIIPVNTPTPTPVITSPIRLIVPKLSIDSLIEPVDVDTNNIVSVPDGWDKAGWYVKAVKPGEIGTAVIVGHYDNQFGQPAIFFYLNKLEVGDNITIIDTEGHSLSFSISNIRSTPNWSSMNSLYKEDNNKNLILITCSGWWNSATHNYSDRLVIEAILSN